MARPAKPGKVKAGVDELEKRLAEALAREAATSEILRIISRSPDLQPVLDAVAEHAARLCQSFDASIFRQGGDRLILVAHHGSIPIDAIGQFSLPVVRGSVGGRSVLDGRTLHVADLQTAVDEFPDAVEHARRMGFRTILSIPLMREGVAIGVIQLRRTEAQPFTDRQVALLQTFADHAVIAIENARLFAALTQAHAQVTEALEQQTATSEVLKVISRSAFDLNPVFETLAENAVRLCAADRVFIFRFDGEFLRPAVSYNASPELREFVERNPIAPGQRTVSARAALERRTVQVADVQADPGYSYARSDVDPIRTTLAVPMLRGDELVGTITIWRVEVKPFTDTQIALLETFADQAVIAIENVRLFKELQTRTAELTRSVGQLTALGEVGQAVSSSLDLETVLATIVARAVELSGSQAGTVWEYDETAEEFRLRLTHNVDGSELLLAPRDAKLKRGEGAVGRLAITHEPVQIPDITRGGAYDSQLRDVLLAAGMRALLAVPLLREGRVLGGLVMSRRTAGEFAPEVVEILETFATQSALAIQNARLFREIEIKSRELEAASQHKSEFLASMSHELRTPLNAIIGFSDVLLQGMFGETNEKQTEYLGDILSSGQHLLSLINDILDLSKIEAGRMELDVAAFDLRTTIDDATLLMRERAGRHEIRLERHVDEGVGEIRADQRKVKQVLLNLLSNAVKFTPAGGRIEVRASLVNGTAEISVADTGIGIAPEHHDAVFEEFRQVGKSDKKTEGTGLGLALCRKFVELHGGRIWVKSQLGVGSTFTFMLPLGQ